METTTIRIDKAIADKVAQYAHATHSSREEIVERALEHYMAYTPEELLELQRRIEAAEQGEFIDDDDMTARLRSHGIHVD